jgi:hypothetical protein
MGGVVGDLKQYMPRLPIETLAQFEPVSGLMVLNVDFETTGVSI